MSSPQDNFERHHALYDALCNAIEKQEVEEVKVLLELGANPNLRHDRVSLLCLATCGDNRAILDMLLLVKAQNNFAIDKAPLAALGPSNPNIRHLFSKLPEKQVMTVEELFLVHELFFDLDARAENLKNHPSPAPQKPAGLREYKGKLSKAAGKKFPDAEQSGQSL